MKSLLSLQRRFQAYVLTPAPDTARELAGAARGDVGRRLPIYAHAYRLRLVAALREDYSKLCPLLGDERFDELARAYIARFPSPHRNIRWVGQQLPAFLREHAACGSEPVLAEMADFERALRDAFDAPDTAILAMDAVAAIPPQAWPAMRPILHPSVRRLDMAWNTVAIWQALDRGHAPPHPQRLERPIAWVIWRKGLNPSFRSLGADEAHALDAIRDGADMQSLCERATDWCVPEPIPLLVARLLKTWLAEGMIAACSGSCADGRPSCPSGPVPD